MENKNTKKLITIGEALIDFIPSTVGCKLKAVSSFARMCGGAPANVAAVCAKLGARSEIITQLGNDAFGDYITDTLNEVGVNTARILRTDAANTSLAFVSLKTDGSREFSFYRNPGADMLLDENDIQPEWFKECGILHFCSVDLIDMPVKYAHIKAIELAKKAGALISFDPNIRLALWQSEDECKKTVREFLNYADIVKLSDEELEFVTGTNDINSAADKLFSQEIQLVLYTLGKSGAMILTPSYGISVPNCDVKVVDTTGAGDSIIGAFLYKLLYSGKCSPADIGEIAQDDMLEYLNFANYYSNYSVTKHGAIASYANQSEIEEFIKNYSNGKE